MNNVLWRHKKSGSTAAILSGNIWVQLATGEKLLLSIDDLEPLDMQNLGPFDEGEQYVKLVIEPGGSELSVQVNGIWPEDVPKFLRLALKVVEGGSLKAWD